MTRKKVKLVWIVNDSARKASLKKRRIGLLKKVSELTILCGVSAFAIIYSPGEAEPMIWPSRSVMQQMLIRYENIPEIVKYKKMMNQEIYLKERLGKNHEHSKKSKKKNRDLEMSYLMDRLHSQRNGIDDFAAIEMQILIWLLEERMRNVRKRVDFFQQVPPLPPLGRPPPLPSRGTRIDMEVMAGSDYGGADRVIQNDYNNLNDAMLLNQRFVDMINAAEYTNVPSSGGGTQHDIGMLPPYAYNHPAGFSGADHLKPYGLGFPLPTNANFTIPSSNGYGGGNAFFDLGQSLVLPSVGGNPFEFGLPHENIAGGSTTTGNAMGLELAPPTSNVGGDFGGNMELSEFLGGGSDTGLPYDFSRGWPHSFSP
ncbi:MADS-box transcription factor PHERES 1-like [Mercurialis annua]|uniref:MADS-box transcription factor PHERES 1-like n=1 Tax=Mercurialis annua TaxID=3986 RepID=UPI00215EC965|nr:MADS-box transcription factor PHERES 1-like [Mercurialis annua]